MIELLQLGREHGYDQLSRAIDQALACGAQDAGAVCFLLTAANITSVPPAPLAYPDEVHHPLPTLTNYDQLLEVVR